MEDNKREDADIAEVKNPVKAIRMFCIDCCGGNIADVRNCASKHCALYAFRFGKNPYRTFTLSETEKEKRAERLAKARAAKKEQES